MTDTALFQMLPTDTHREIIEYIEPDINYESYLAEDYINSIADKMEGLERQIDAFHPGRTHGTIGIVGPLGDYMETERRIDIFQVIFPHCSYRVAIAYSVDKKNGTMKDADISTFLDDLKKDRSSTLTLYDARIYYDSINKELVSLGGGFIFKDKMIARFVSWLESILERYPLKRYVFVYIPPRFNGQGKCETKDDLPSSKVVPIEDAAQIKLAEPRAIIIPHD